MVLTLARAAIAAVGLLLKLPENAGRISATAGVTKDGRDAAAITNDMANRPLQRCDARCLRFSMISARTLGGAVLPFST